MATAAGEDEGKGGGEGQDKQDRGTNRKGQFARVVKGEGEEDWVGVG